MKTPRRNKFSRSVLILMTILLLLHMFVSCGGIPTSQIEEKETISSLVEKETDQPTTTTVTYVASRESDKYHRTRCHYVDNILQDNLVYYTSEEAARRAGKSPCSVCKP